MEGLGLLHRPKAFGGDPEKALAALDLAIEYFSPHVGDPIEGWAYAEAHVWRGIVHHRLGHADRARADFETAVSIEPGYRWAAGLLARAGR